MVFGVLSRSDKIVLGYRGSIDLDTHYGFVTTALPLISQFVWIIIPALYCCCIYLSEYIRIHNMQTPCELAPAFHWRQRVSYLIMTIYNDLVLCDSFSFNCFVASVHTSRSQFIVLKTCTLVSFIYPPPEHSFARAILKRNIASTGNTALNKSAYVCPQFRVLSRAYGTMASSKYTRSIMNINVVGSKPVCLT